MFHIERGVMMKKRVNLADVKQARELLTQLYGHKNAQDAQESTITENHTPSTTREERGNLVYRMGLQPAYDQGFNTAHTERGKAILMGRPAIGQDGVKKGRK